MYNLSLPHPRTTRDEREGEREEVRRVSTSLCEKGEGRERRRERKGKEGWRSEGREGIVKAKMRKKREIREGWKDEEWEEGKAKREGEAK